MADLNLRNVDAELMKELKRAAVEAGVSLKEICVQRLSAESLKPPKMIIEKVAKAIEKPKATELKTVDSKAIWKQLFGDRPPVNVYERPAHAENCRCYSCKPPK